MVVRQRPGLETSVERCLQQLDSADRQEPSRVRIPENVKPKPNTSSSHTAWVDFGLPVLMAADSARRSSTRFVAAASGNGYYWKQSLTRLELRTLSPCSCFTGVSVKRKLTLSLMLIVNQRLVTFDSHLASRIVSF